MSTDKAKSNEDALSSLQEGSVTTETMTSPSNTLPNLPGKRSKPSSSSEEDKDTTVSPNKATKKSKLPEQSSSDAPAPAYGSQAYWEERYQRQFSATDEDQVGETLKYHAWYFRYADLRPLILPLILGGRNDAQLIMKRAEEEEEEENEQENERDSDDYDEEKEKQVDDQGEAEVDEEFEQVTEQQKQSSTGGEKVESNPDSEEENPQENEEEEDDDEDSFVEVGEDEEEEEEDDDIEREGLSKDGPISIIEIGCGDVPLGAGLALEFLELEETTNLSSRTIVEKILCTDYSPTVIETMRSKYKKFDDKDERPKDSAHIGDIPLEFAIADARKTNFADGSFQLILEKGTLDAMLSDKQEGVANCVQIMRECARILATTGYIVLVSHLNAHTDRGRGWLRDVVFEGLKGGDAHASWMIEVHGNAEIRDDLPGVPPNSPGPAVYIIKKKAMDTAVADEQSTIPVKFFSY